MIKLISLLSLIVATMTTNAQTTNVTIRVTVVDGSGTNVFNNITASPAHIYGFIIAQERMHRIAGTNSLPFANAVRAEVIDRLTGVAKDGAAEDMERRRVNAAASQLPAVWQAMSAEDQAALVALFQKYVP